MIKFLENSGIMSLFFCGENMDSKLNLPNKVTLSGNEEVKGLFVELDCHSG